MEPTLAHMDEAPRPTLRTTVGSSSPEKRYRAGKVMDMPSTARPASSDRGQSPGNTPAVHGIHVQAGAVKETEGDLFAFAFPDRGCLRTEGDRDDEQRRRGRHEQ